ncbi:MAG TPA: hypothetical protein VG942_07855, partial [Hyphomonadaceae bacterium]|nr:hypothetical protein [Hyphomonadaceae bacterium]
MQAALPDERFIVPTPGMRITAERSGVKDVAETSAFLKPLPKAQWPDRAYKPETKPSSTVEPASGRSALRPGELEELTQRLADFAAFLYGGSLFRSLYSFTDSALPEGVRPVFAINAMSGDQDHVFEYDPTGPAFTLLAKPSSMSGYVAAVECFATDLLEFLQGRIAPSALMFGRLLRWRAPPENLTAAIDRAIWLYGHPLRRPSAYLDLYRSIYANEARDVPKVQARRA